MYSLESSSNVLFVLNNQFPDEGIVTTQHALSHCLYHWAEVAVVPGWSSDVFRSAAILTVPVTFCSLAKETQ